jgi:hypothetical protein
MTTYLITNERFDMPARRSNRNKSKFNYGSYFREMRDTQDLTTKPEDVSWTLTVPFEADAEPHDVVLYLGCNVLRTSHMIKTATDILDLLGVDYIAVGGPAYCCGIVHHRNGDVELAESISTNAIRYMERYKPSIVAMWCPSCISYYDEVFEIDTSFKTQHFSEFLVDRLEKFNFVNEVPLKVGLHSHMTHPKRIEEARAAMTLLSAVPGMECIELESDTRLGISCSPNTQNAVGMNVWEEIVEGQLSTSVDAGIDAFATMYHGCQRTICTYEEKYPIEIEHYLSIFARGLGIEHEDTYKKYSLWKDPTRVLADMAPCMEATGVKPERAKKLVDLTFPA